MAQTVYFYPDDGYELSTVEVNGVAVSVIGNSYTLSAVDKDAAVRAAFRPASAATQRPNVYKTVTASSGTGGSISPAGEVSVEYGGGIYYYFIPDSSCEVDEVSVDGTVASVSDNFYRFINVIADHTISVTFRKTAEAPVYHTVTASSGAHGRISPGGNVQVPDGGEQTFTFFPDENYAIDTVSVDGAATPVSGSSYRLSDITSDHTVFVSFRKAAVPEPTVYHTVKVSAVGSGSISPSGDVRVAYGGAQSFCFIAEDGCEMEAIYINGVKQAVVGTQFTIDNITEDMELSVVFKPVGEPHCFICRLLGRNVAPWCWLVPLIFVVCLGAAAVIYLRKRR